VVQVLPQKLLIYGTNVRPQKMSKKQNIERNGIQQHMEVLSSDRYGRNYGNN
jgi:hypothetical protein